MIRTVKASKSDLANARARAAKMKELEDWRAEQSKETTEKAKAEAARTGVQFGAVFDRLRKSEHEASKAKYREHGLEPPTYENVTRLAPRELESFALGLFNASRANAWWLAAGLVLTAAGSVWSIYV